MRETESERESVQSLQTLYPVLPRKPRRLRKEGERTSTRGSEVRT